MVTSREGVSDDISSGKLQQSENSVVGHDGSVSNQKGSPLSVLPAKQSSSTEQVASELTQENSTHPVIPEKVPNDLKPIQSPDDVIDASQSNQEGSSLSIVNDSDTRTSVSYQDGSSLSTIPKKELDNSNTGILTSENKDGKALTTVPENLPDTLLQNLDHGIMVHASQSDQEKSTLSRTPEKVLGKLPLRRNPDISAPVLQSVQEGNTHFKIPEKPSEDGYNWRKYGQKLVRGNQFVRSYYKCTFPNCPAKKQVERSHEGNITNINCRGQHEHPKPQQSPQIAVPIQARKPDPPLIRSEDETSNVNHNDAPHHIVPMEALPPIETPKLLTSEAHVDAMEGAASESNKTRDKADRDGYPDPKRRKRDNSTMDDTLSSANRTNGESRVVVQTTCLVDIVNDGYRWRKYGQKLVKGNANPRSYYRCSSTGCPVKKHVERASHDPKVVITTYEGQHDHEMPSSARTVTPNAPVTPSRSEPEEEKEAGPLDLVVHGTAN